MPTRCVGVCVLAERSEGHALFERCERTSQRKLLEIYLMRAHDVPVQLVKSAHALLEMDAKEGRRRVRRRRHYGTGSALLAGGEYITDSTCMRTGEDASQDTYRVSKTDVACGTVCEAGPRALGRRVGSGQE